MLHRILKFVDQNNLHDQVSVIDLFKVKPIDQSLSLVLKNMKIITYEEHCADGGFGSAISEFITDNKIKLN